MHGTGQTQYYQQDNSLQNNDGYNYNNYNDTTDGTSFTLTEANLKAYEEQESNDNTAATNKGNANNYFEKKK